MVSEYRVEELFDELASIEYPLPESSYASVGELVSRAVELGMVCHFDNKGYFTGCSASFLDEAGVCHSEKDVARVCYTIGRLVQRAARLGENN